MEVEKRESYQILDKHCSITLLRDSRHEIMETISVFVSGLRLRFLGSLKATSDVTEGCNTRPPTLL